MRVCFNDLAVLICSSAVTEQGIAILCLRVETAGDMVSL
jgi:hypothetical protein